jgi:hypothetical protein
MGNPRDRDRLDAWLNAEVEPLAPPPGTFERIRRRGADYPDLHSRRSTRTR